MENNPKQYVAQFWTEADGWQDSQFDFDTEDEAGEFVYDLCQRSGNVWRYYDADAQNEADQLEEMRIDAERSSAASPVCGCEWGCWRCNDED